MQLPNLFPNTINGELHTESLFRALSRSDFHLIGWLADPLIDVFSIAIVQGGLTNGYLWYELCADRFHLAVRLINTYPNYAIIPSSGGKMTLETVTFRLLGYLKERKIDWIKRIPGTILNPKIS